ncbi:putative glutamine amidotransferase [Rubricella aquisinus]|uniref:Putative glutamine amidotransferase n=1 Tax=Rubricella aquisinus TaxID=2028108 RepID=A0A840WLN8_9RHOB|nr:gamma-glutamyl-gamma-aminobutyrate hydrolase family protein [Rubricella aquisinus]MBB5515969.1 putative glutamine amidotransferase [Rubricella aquisinus]
MTRPIIGVTTSKRSGWRIFPLMWLAVFLAGGRAVRWVTGRDADITKVDGVIVGGGDDISPDLYGGDIVAKARLDQDRDALEKRLVLEAFAIGKPVFGICRGAQMINVALGGNLNQNAYETYGNRERPWTILPLKQVDLVEDSRIACIAGPQEMEVNSLHSQSVEDLGEGLHAVGHDQEGMIQAVERRRDPFLMGVQWHPEHLLYARRQRALFRAVVDAARAYRDNQNQMDAVDRGIADA